MIKISIEVREDKSGSVSAKINATPMIATQTAKEHRMTQWILKKFGEIMTSTNAEEKKAEDRN